MKVNFTIGVHKFNKCKIELLSKKNFLETLRCTYCKTGDNIRRFEEEYSFFQTFHILSSIPVLFNIGSRRELLHIFGRHTAEKTIFKKNLMKEVAISLSVRISHINVWNSGKNCSFHIRELMNDSKFYNDVFITFITSSRNKFTNHSEYKLVNFNLKLYMYARVRKI